MGDPEVHKGDLSPVLDGENSTALNHPRSESKESHQGRDDEASRELIRDVLGGLIPAENGPGDENTPIDWSSNRQRPAEDARGYHDPSSSANVASKFPDRFRVSPPVSPSIGTTYGSPTGLSWEEPYPTNFRQDRGYGSQQNNPSRLQTVQPEMGRLGGSGPNTMGPSAQIPFDDQETRGLVPGTHDYSQTQPAGLVRQQTHEQRLQQLEMQRQHRQRQNLRNRLQ